MAEKICPNWLLCRGSGVKTCHHRQPHKYCKLENVPCNHFGRCGVVEKAGTCLRSKMGGCVEVEGEEDVNA